MLLYLLPAPRESLLALTHQGFRAPTLVCPVSHYFSTLRCPHGWKIGAVRSSGKYVGWWTPRSVGHGLCPR
jgi:hypothetical protein